MNQRTAGCFVCGVIGLCAQANAGVNVLALQWEFYQGGYVQDPADNWAVFQDHYDRNPELNVVTYTLGGAFFESSASMAVSSADEAGLFQLSALSFMSVSASVEASSVEGAAQAFAGLSLFNASFSLSAPMTYLGSESLEDELGSVHASGSTLDPGVYTYLMINPFPPMTQTLMVGPGESEYVESSYEYWFRFSTIPSPGGLGLIGLWLSRRRRRR